MLTSSWVHRFWNKLLASVVWELWARPWQKATSSPKNCCESEYFYQEKLASDLTFSYFPVSITCQLKIISSSHFHIPWLWKACWLLWGLRSSSCFFIHMGVTIPYLFLQLQLWKQHQLHAVIPTVVQGILIRSVIY